MADSNRELPGYLAPPPSRPRPSRHQPAEYSRLPIDAAERGIAAGRAHTRRQPIAIRPSALGRTVKAGSELRHWSLWCRIAMMSARWRDGPQST